MPDRKDDWTKPFPERFLACADALSVAEHWLAVVGMSGNVHFQSLKSEFIQHGGATFNDMKRTAETNNG